MTDPSAIADSIAAAGLTLRPIADADLPFLERVYGGTRAQELALVGWSEAQQAAFVHQQFEAQHQYYQQHYPGAAFSVVLLRGRPVGRLYLERWRDQIRIIDIALLAEFQRQSIGSTLLRAILSEGRRLELPVTIHVERFNPALRLYERLGFGLVEDKGVYLLLEKHPDAGTA
jgi:ribosomal protein S18 acetylase RimI-like enzyme